MLKEFKSFVEKHNLIKKDDRILLAISGGVDSMVLAKLLLLRQQTTDNGQQTSSTIQQLNLVTETVEVSTVQSSEFRVQSSIALAHCNFHLRGEDSNRDEKFVTDFAKENNIPIYIKHFDTESYAKENSLSIEMAARELRYAWFKELKETHNFNKVALAHHGDDQIETFFINFLRGSGIKGLKGMKPQNDFYIRPLLWSNRNEIVTFAKENGIQWVEDYTNQETIYLRNKIRHNIIPIFDEMKNNARQSLNFSINCLSSENDLYRTLIDEKLSNIESVPEPVEGTILGASTSSATAFPRSVENKYFLQDASGKQLLFEWVRRYDFNFNQAESMFEAMKNGKSGVMFYNDNGQQTTDNRLCPRLMASVQKDKIEIFEEKENDEIIVIKTQRLKDAKTQSDDDSATQRRKDAKTQRLKDSKTQSDDDSATLRRKDAKTQRLYDAKTQSDDDSATLRLKDAKTQSDDDSATLCLCDSVSLRLCDSVSLRLNSYNKDENFRLIKDPSVAAQFDMDKIAFPLKLRHWRKGDKFRPLGMKGSKLLSDFFNDLGFSAYQKQNVWIMEDANGLILWVVGYRINDKVKILDSTKVIFQCDLEH